MLPRFFFALIAPLLITSGCSTLAKQTFREPKVRVISLMFEENPPPASLAAIPLTVTIEVNNPNAFSIKAKYLTYTVTAGEETLASGEKSELIEIPPDMTSYIDIPVTISLEPIIRSLSRAAKNLDISVTAYGSMTLASFLGDVKIPFRKHFRKNLRSLILP